MNTDKPIQDYYAEDHSVCYGCGTLNPHGLQIKCVWEEDECVCRFTPEDYHTAFPGIVYGGILACLIDCHCIGTAVAAAYREENRSHDTDPPIMFITGTLNVKYLSPTKHGVELELRARVAEVKDRKTIVTCRLFAEDRETANGEVIAFRKS